MNAGDVKKLMDESNVIVVPDVADATPDILTAVCGYCKHTVMDFVGNNGVVIFNHKEDNDTLSAFIFHVLLDELGLVVKFIKVDNYSY